MRGLWRSKRLGERFRGVTGDAAKSGLLVDAPAQGPADAGIQLNHQHALPVGIGRQPNRIPGPHPFPPACEMLV